MHHTLTHGNTLQHTATHAATHTATHTATHAATHRCELGEWWNKVKVNPNVDYLLGEIEASVNNFFAAEPHTCSCHEKDWKHFPLPHTPTHCNTLHHTPTHWKHFPLPYFYQGMEENRLQVCVAVWCGVLQRVVVYFMVLKCVGV